MASFDDSADPELGAACDRLAAWVEPLPPGEVIDAAGGLTETDLAVILRHLHATRLATRTSSEQASPTRASVPITVRD